MRMGDNRPRRDRRWYCTTAEQRWAGRPFSLSETKNAQRTATGTPHIFVVLVNNVRAQRRSAREGQNSLPASGLASASSAALLLCLPPATQCPQHFFYLPPFLSENDFSALFWRKHIVIFAIPNRMQ